jgi:hypothetical protein
LSVSGNSFILLDLDSQKVETDSPPSDNKLVEEEFLIKHVTDSKQILKKSILVFSLF